MHRKAMHLMFLMMLSIVFPALASAEGKPEVVLDMTARKEVAVKGEDGKTLTEWRVVKETNPGDVIKYSIKYTNEGKTEARDTVIVDSVPEGTEYVSDSAEGQDSTITFSLDGKTFQSAPMLRYKVKQPDGTEAEYKATPDMYTHLRWKLVKPVPAGGSGTVSFKVKVK